MNLLISKSIKYLLILCAVVLFSCESLMNNKNVLKSPDGKNSIQFDLVEGVPFYSVKHGEKTIIHPSKMGFIFKNNDHFDSSFELITSNVSGFDETWEQVWGEKRFIRNQYNQLSVVLQEKQGEKRQLEIEFREFDDGIDIR